jgi:hypothetical protein
MQDRFLYILGGFAILSGLVVVAILIWGAMSFLSSSTRLRHDQAT